MTHSLYASVMRCYALFLLGTGDYETCEYCMRNAIEVDTHVFGSPSDSDVKLLGLIGKSYLDAGSIAEAQRLLEEMQRLEAEYDIRRS